MRFLKQNTATRVTVGPFLDVTDGKSPELSLTVTGCHLTLMVDDAGVPTLALDADATASGGNNDMVHVTDDNAGFYDLELTAAQTNYVGRAMLAVVDDDVHLPVFHEFMIMPANVYDSFFGTDKLQVHADEITNGLITAAAIADDAIDAGSIATGALTADAFAADAIVAATLATGAITADAFAADAIVAATLATGALTADAFAANAITSTAIADDAITAAKLNTGAITADAFAANAIVAATLAADCITEAKIADNAIAAEHLAANAIDLATFAADVKTGSALKANVETITNGAITAAAIATGAIDADAIADNAIDAGAIASGALTAAKVADDLYTRLGIVAYGTAQAATSTTIRLADASAFEDDELNGAVVVITGGDTGVGQSRVITDYTKTTPTADNATVDAWTTTPSGTITYVVFAAAPASATSLPAVNVTQFGGSAGTFSGGRPEVNTTHAAGTAWGSGAITAASIATGAIDADALAADAGTEIGTAVWATTARTLTAATNITSTGGTTVPQTGDSYARLGAPAGASVSADIAAIEAQTDDIGAAGAGLTAVPWNAAWDAEVQSEVEDGLAAYGAPLLTTVVESEGNVTLQQVLQALLAACAGVTDDADTSPILFKTPNGNATRISATVDGTNRTAITLTFA